MATAAASAAELAHGHYLEDGNIHDVGDHRQPSHSVYFHHDHAQYVPAIALSTTNARHQLSKRSFKTKKFGKKAIKFGVLFILNWRETNQLYNYHQNYGSYDDIAYHDLK